MKGLFKRRLATTAKKRLQRNSDDLRSLGNTDAFILKSLVSLVSAAPQQEELLEGVLGGLKVVIQRQTSLHTASDSGPYEDVSAITESLRFSLCVELPVRMNGCPHSFFTSLGTQESFPHLPQNKIECASSAALHLELTDQK